MDLSIYCTFIWMPIELDFTTIQQWLRSMKNIHIIEALKDTTPEPSDPFNVVFGTISKTKNLKWKAMFENLKFSLSSIITEGDY